MGKQIVDGYQVIITAEHNTRRGVAWTGNLIKDGVVIGRIEQSGNGGQTGVYIGQRQDQEAFEEIAKRRNPRSYEAPSRFAEQLADDDHE